jgi:flagellar hook protein FlgE
MSYYTSLSGLQNAQTDLSVIGNNIANADTNGFKKSSVDFSNLVAASAFTNPKNIVGIGSTVQSINQDFAQGGVKQTGSALDLMISGDGFFTTSSAVTGQVYYTRNGSFSMDGQGYLTDGSGNRLQVFPTDSAGTVTSTTPGSVQIPLTNSAGSQFSGATVAADGSISVSYADGSNSVIGKVALASFVTPQGLKQVGSSNYTSTGISGTATYGQPSRPVRQPAVGLARSLERRPVLGNGEPHHRPAVFPGQRQGDRREHDDQRRHHQSQELIGNRGLNHG